ncbi:MAG: arginine--tRNA ligase, partial [Erysipelotrichaceae bacterium]
MNPIEHQLKLSIHQAVKLAFDIDISLDDIIIEVPKHAEYGDYSSNIAMRLSKTLKQNPKGIAESIILKLDKAIIEKTDIAGAGFINFFLQKSSISSIINTIIEQNETVGQSIQDPQLHYNIEYVSANPTGDLHPGHARGAAIGDALSRIMKKAGYIVTREYYINDAGNQINNMAISLQARYLQICGLDTQVPEDGYQGQDLKDIAQILFAEVKTEYKDMSLKDSLPFFRQYGLKAEIAKLKEDLELFRVEFDVWTSEQSLYDQKLVEQALIRLTDLNKTYTLDGAVWLKTTEYGDDKDRVLVKSDGSYTYILPDIAYHLHKKQRGYDKLVDLLGADHHGYIARLQAAFQALGYQKEDLSVDIIQMARMIKDGLEFKLSKRTGQAVALKDLIEEAGVDAVRYYFVSKASDTHMDLDLDMAKKQSSENPVYYAQYAHARMCAILRQAEFTLPTDLSHLTHPKEIELLKILADYAQLILDSANSRQPH